MLRAGGYIRVRTRLFPLKAKMSKVVEVFAVAVRASNLKSEPDTTFSHCDVVGAVGLAGKRHALATALLRLFVGDNHAAEELAELLAGMLVGKAYRLGAEVTRTEASDIAKAVLAWHRNGTCQPCGGIGYEVIGADGGRRVVTDHHCKRCRGTGKLLFHKQFNARHLELAQWLLAEIEREQAMAGPEAMRMLAPRLDL